MIDLASVLGQDNFDGFMRGLVRGRYHTLLGAGASAGGTGGDGKPLPVGAALADDIAAEFELDAGAASLRRIFAAAQRRHSPKGESLNDYIGRRFTRTDPPAWLERFVRLQWAHIWTLNVDDCLEGAYTNYSRSARQQPMSISWTERHRTPRQGLDEVLIVHLHGKASRAHRDGELIFDISAYLHAANAQFRWHTIFGDYYPSEPFLVIGASLDEEIDLQVILEQGRSRLSTDHPSILVTRDIDALQGEEYRDYGLLPVAATAEDFFEAVEAALQPFIDELTHAESSKLTDISPTAVTFLNQWQALSTSDKFRPDLRHDIFAGHQPEWRDVIADKLASRDAASQLLARITGPVNRGDAKVLLLRGGIFSGKSAVLLSLAKLLIEAGFQPFLHLGDAAPDAEAAVHWLQHYPRSVLLMDDAFDFTFDIARIVSLAQSAGVSPRMVLTERSSRARGSDRNLAVIDVDSRTLSDTLSDGEIARLIEKLTDHRRLGVLTGLQPRERTRFFHQHGRELFSAMAGLERGRGFEARVRDEYAAVPSASHNLVGLSALCSHLGYGLPITIVPRATGHSIADAETLLSEGPLADLLTASRGYIRPRHRIFGTILVETCLTREDRYSLAADLAAGLAQHVSPAAIGVRNIYYLIARALMTHKVLETLFEHDYDEVLRWYEEAESAYDWNARFWEQRALAASLAGLFEPAYSWAKQAVDVRSDAFTLNTVGTILMRRALSEAAPHLWPTDSFEAAEEALREARGLEAEASEYPYETFFSYTLRLADAVAFEALPVEQLRMLWQQWYAQCLLLDRASLQRLRPTLDYTQPRWRRLLGDG